MKQQSGLPKPVTSAPAFRRRRTIWFLLACIICSIIFFSSSISVPGHLFGSSSTEPNPLLRDALELHGLQHFVLNSGTSLHKVLYKANRDRPQGVLVHDHARNGDNENRGDGEVPDPEHERLDPTKDIDLKVYSSFDGDDDWVKHVRELQTNSPLVVFSKVRFKDGFRTFPLESRLYGDRDVHTTPRSVSPYGEYLRPHSARVLSFCSPSSEEREADVNWPFPHMSPPSGPSMHTIVWDVNSRIAHIQGGPRASFRPTLWTPLPR